VGTQNSEIKTLIRSLGEPRENGHSLKTRKIGKIDGPKRLKIGLSCEVVGKKRLALTRQRGNLGDKKRTGDEGHQGTRNERRKA